MTEPLQLKTSYPSTDDISYDAISLRIISPAYASSTGELNAVLQYIYHYFFFKRAGKNDIAEKLISIAISEMKHLEILGQTILALGAPPVFCRNPYTRFDFYSAKFVAYSRSLKEMIEDDIIGEKHAISSYGHMISNLKNESVKAVIERILGDEKLHLETLREILNDFKG